MLNPSLGGPFRSLLRGGSGGGSGVKWSPPPPPSKTRYDYARNLKFGM